MSQQRNHSNISKTITMHEYLKTNEWIHLIGIVFQLVAEYITLYQGYQHYRWNTKKQERRRIINILYIVPIYGVYTFPLLAITYPDRVIHLTNIRDCYGAFAMYNFLVLCYEYLGGEGNVMTELSGRPVPVSLVNSAKIYTDRFHRFCKFAVMQFCITRVVCAFIIYVIMDLWRNYRYGDWSDICYISITVVTSMSAALALYALSIFIKAVRNFIKPDPTLKFFVVTSVIYVTYWQEIALAVLENVGVIASASDASGRPVIGEASKICQDFLTSIISFGAAIALRVVFSVPDKRPTANVIMTVGSNESLDPLL